MAERKKTAVRLQVTLDFDLGQFWEEDNTLEEIQTRAENMLHNMLMELPRTPKIVGKVSVILAGGTK